MITALVHGHAQAHYPTRSERIADQIVHIIGLASAAIGAPVLVALAAHYDRAAGAAAAAIYAVCLIVMLAVSAGYNLARGAALQRRLRRFDHAAIFLMIAGSYTPFTTQHFEGALAIWMTAAVWVIALAAAGGKLFLPGVAKWVWIPIYLLLGWMVVGALGPLVDGLRPAALVLLVVGGVIYTAGVAIYVWPRLPFRRAIWHGFVFAAASAHYAAILIGVVLG